MNEDQKGYWSGLLRKLLLLRVGAVEGSYTWIGEADGRYSEFADGRVFLKQSRVSSIGVWALLASHWTGTGVPQIYWLSHWVDMVGWGRARDLIDPWRSGITYRHQTLRVHE